MNQKLISTDKIILLFSVLTTLFFALLFLNNSYIKSDFVLIGVVQELFTIPCLLLQPTFFFIAVKRLFKVKGQGMLYLLFSILILLISITVTWISFIN